MRKDDVESALSRGWLGGAGLRREDAQKAQELVPMLDEIERMAARLKGDPLVIVDACAGKGALGMLASLMLTRATRVVLVDRDDVRQRVVEAARVLGAADVTFVVGDVSALPKADLVVALHACGGASDAVIDAAIAGDARALLLVPCCYGAGPRHEGAGLDVRAQPLADAWTAKLPLPAHAIIGKRMAQGFIDAERTLRLEAAGYETEVLEVFASTISPHNLLWRSRRVKEPVRMQRAREQLERFRLRGAGVPPVTDL